MSSLPLDSGHSPGYYDPIPNSDFGDSWFISIESQLSSRSIDPSDDSEASTDLESHSLAGSQRNRESSSSRDVRVVPLAAFSPKNSRDLAIINELPIPQSTNDNIIIPHTLASTPMARVTPAPSLLPVAKRLRKRTIEQLYPYRIELERYRMNLKQTGVNVSRKEIRKEDGVSGNDHGSTSNERKASEERNKKNKSNSLGRADQGNEHGDSTNSHVTPPSRSHTPDMPNSSQRSPTSETIRRRRRIISDADSDDVDEDISREHDASSRSSWSSDQNSQNEADCSESDSSDDDIMTLAMFKKRVKGVLPPSFITLEYAKFQKEQKMKKAAEKRQQQREQSNSPVVPLKGVAKRKIRRDLPSVDLLAGDLRSVDLISAGDLHTANENGENHIEQDQFDANHSANRIDLSIDSSPPMEQLASPSVFSNEDQNDIAEEDQIDYMGMSRARTKNRNNKGNSHRNVRSGNGDKQPRASRNDAAASTRRGNTYRKSQTSRQTRLVSSSAVSISDICHHLRKRGSTPRFMNVAERTASIRTNHRPDNYRHKYISIEDNDHTNSVSSSQMTLERWSRGSFTRKTNGTHQRASAPKAAKRPARWKNAQMIRIDGHQEHSKRKTSGKTTETSHSNVHVRQNSKQSYLEARRRHVQTAILEVPSGRFAIRRNKPKKDVFQRPLGMHSNHIHSQLAPSVQLDSHKQLNTSLRHEPFKQKSAKKSQAVHSKHLKQHRTGTARSLFPVGVSVSCSIDMPADDLHFNSNSFIGKGFLQNILDGQPSADCELERLLVIELGRSIITFDGSSFSSSLGRTIAALKELMNSDMNVFQNDESYFEAIEPFYNALFAYVSSGEALHDDLELLVSALHELIDHIWSKWTEWQERGIFSHEVLAAASFKSFSLSLMILQSLSFVGITELANGEYIPAFVHEQLTKMTKLIFMKGGTGHVRDMVCKHRSSLHRTIGADSYLIECLVMAWTFLGNFEMQNISTVIAQSVIDVNIPSTLEEIWILTFVFCYVQKLAKNFGTSEPSQSWKVPKLALSTVISQISDDLRDDNLGQYLSISIARCIHLVNYWDWPVDRPLVVNLFDFFAGRQFNNVEEIRENVSLPALFSNEQNLLQYDRVDSAFNSFLKLAAFSIISLTKANLLFDIRKLNARITPLNSRHYSRKSALKISDLEALCNQYSILLLMFVYCPADIRPSIDQLRDTNQLNESHIRARSLGVSVWEKVTMKLLKEGKDVEPAMNWLNDLLENTVKEYDELEETTVDSSIEHERRSDNQQTYETFFVETIGVWNDLLIRPWTTVSSAWYKLLSKILMKILRHVVSNEITDISLDLLSNFFETATNGTDTSVDEHVKPFEYYHDQLLREFYQFMSNIIGSDYDHSRRVLVKSVQIWALTAKCMVLHDQMNWESFFGSSYCWSWFADSGKRSMLEPIWWSELLRQESSLAVEDQYSSYFEEQFFNCVVTSNPIYEHRYITEYLKYSDKQYVSWLQDYRSQLSTSKALVSKQRTLLRSLIEGFSSVQFDEPELVKQVIGAILGIMRRNYISHSNERYHAFAEYVLGSVVELIELPHIANLDWFRNSANFELAAVTLDTANVRKYLRMQLTSSNRARLLMFMVYSLEGSLVNSSGQTFIESVSSALCDGFVSRECFNCLLDVLFPNYAQVALRSEVGESIFPVVLETVTKWASFVSAFKQLRISDYSLLIRAVLSYLKSEGFYAQIHPYWGTVKLFFEFLHHILDSSFDKGLETYIDEELFLSVLKVAGDIVIGERTEQESTQIENESNDEITSKAIFQSLGHYERNDMGNDNQWKFRSRLSSNEFVISNHHAERARQITALFIRQLFQQPILSVTLLDYHRHLLVRARNHPELEGLVELIDVLPSKTVQLPDISTIDELIL